MIQGADELVAVKSTLAVQEERTCTDDELDATELDSMEIPGNWLYLHVEK